MKKKISKVDQDNLKIIRRNVIEFLRICGKKYDKTGKLLDIAPQDYEGAKPFFKKATIHTLDIASDSGATFIADICKRNDKIIRNNAYDFIVCTEVFEHTLQPFKAIEEIYRILKRGGYLFISVPFNFRIHGPLPDCWRFTEHGLREILKNFKNVKINQIETPGRALMPIHYTVTAQK